MFIIAGTLWGILYFLSGQPVAGAIRNISTNVYVL